MCGDGARRAGRPHNKEGAGRGWEVAAYLGTPRASSTIFVGLHHRCKGRERVCRLDVPADKAAGPCVASSCEARLTFGTEPRHVINKRPQSPRQAVPCGVIFPCHGEEGMKRRGIRKIEKIMKRMKEKSAKGQRERKERGR